MRKREDFLAYMELNNQNMMSWEDKVSFLTYDISFLLYSHLFLQVLLFAILTVLKKIKFS